MRIPVNIFFAFLLVPSSALRAQTSPKPLTADTLPRYLTNYERNLIPLEGAYGQMENDPMPLYDQQGQPLGHRPLEDRRQLLANLRETLHKLSAKPGDLRLALRLFFQTDDLTDDLYELSQFAYDNDREELGKQLSDIMNTLDRDRAVLENYALGLAEESEARLEELEKRNQELEAKAKGAAKK